MAIYAARSGLKGLFERVFVAVLVIIHGKIPVVWEESSIPKGIENRLLSSETFAPTAPRRDDEK